MRKIKNLDNKTVCLLSKEKQAVEIKIKNCKTVISFAGGKIDIKNYREKKGEKKDEKF